MKKLRVAFLSGGRFAHIHPYIEFFMRRGHEVSWIKYDYSERTCGVRAYDISLGARGDQRWSKWKYLLAGLRIRKVLREVAPDIMHGHYVTSAGVISWMSGFVPYVLTAHGSDIIQSLNSKFWRYMLTKAMAKATLVNPVSSELANRITQFGVPQNKLFTATLGVDTGRFAFQSRRRSGTFWRLICTRTLADVYDPAVILKACVKLKEHGLRFQMTFAAGGPLLTELKQTAFALNLNDDVKFLGGYDNSDLPMLLRSSDLFVSASLWDGTSISLLEAMAVGIFPVVSRIAANTAWLRDGETAFMFDCGDETQLADAILCAVDNDQIWQNACEANRYIVVHEADRSANMLALEEKFYEILER